MISGLLRLAKPFLPHLAIALAIIGAVWFISHRATMAERGRQEAAQAKADREAEQRTRRIEKALSGAVAAIDGTVAGSIENIRTIRQTIVQPLQKELQIETRYRDTACAVTDGVRDNINRARAASGDPPAAGVSGVTVPLGPDAD